MCDFSGDAIPCSSWLDPLSNLPSILEEVINRFKTGLASLSKALCKESQINGKELHQTPPDSPEPLCTLTPTALNSKPRLQKSKPYTLNAKSSVQSSPRIRSSWDWPSTAFVCRLDHRCVACGGQYGTDIRAVCLPHRKPHQGFQV